MQSIKYVVVGLVVGFAQLVSGQVIEGYAYENGNRGYLNVVHVQLLHQDTDTVAGETFSDTDGRFELEIPDNGNYYLTADKEMFQSKRFDLDRSTASNGKLFLKIEMKRLPGYIFDVTLAPKRDSEDDNVDAIKGALIEVYNNTTREEVLVLPDHPEPAFRMDLQKGNHYTILVRKKGYLAKRMEAYVNVKGCILCFEGVGDVIPGVADNLSEGNEMGVLLANVEMEHSFEGKKMTINNIYYDLDRANLRAESKEELQTAIYMMQDNPTIAVEIGSHTDSRGKTDYNQKLSEDRAEEVVSYLLQNSNIEKSRLIYKGYGESQIINRCTDDVKCSEVEHQVNRRTEMKIIGTVAAPVQQSLAEMKRLEQMDVLIAELQEQEEVEVSNEAELQQLMKQDEGSTTMKVPATNVESPRSPADITSTTPQALPTQDTEENTQQESKTTKPQASQLNSGMTDDMAESRRNSRRIAERRRKKLEAQINNNLVVEPETKEKEPTDPVSPPSVGKQTSEPAPPVNTEENEVLARGLDGKPVTGYMVVISETKEPLATDNDIFKRHSTVYSYRSEGKYLYMLGRYPTQVSAEREVKAFLSTTYPGAYIMQFIDGRVTKVLR